MTATRMCRGVQDRPECTLRITGRSGDWIYKFFPDIDGPAGGIRSSAMDMAKWAGVQLGQGSWGGRTILRPCSIEYLFAPKTLMADDPQFLSHASGWIFLPRSPYPLIFHGGDSPGFTSLVALVPEANAGIVVLCNLGNSTSPNNIIKKFYELFCDEPTATTSSLKFEIPETPISPFPASSTSADRNLPTSKGTSLPLDRYCGVYSNPAYGKFSVKLESGSLVMIMGPQTSSPRRTPDQVQCSRRGPSGSGSRRDEGRWVYERATGGAPAEEMITDGRQDNFRHSFHRCIHNR